MIDEHTPRIGRARLIEYLLTLPLFLLPQHLLCRWMYAATRCPWEPWKNWQIRWFIRRYGVDMSIAQNPDPGSYGDFNRFFTRPLLETARPIVPDRNAVACPVDGAVSQIGLITHGKLFQAKGRSYSLSELLADDQALAGVFEGGSFATLYLAPKDYHRVHMPLTGTLAGMTYVPGRLLPVNPRTTHTTPSLFGRNERVITVFQTEAGLMTLILVGALFVGSLETVWVGAVRPAPKRQEWDYARMAPVVLGRGDEMGRFNMGSTVILLFAKDRVSWTHEIGPGAVVKMGQRLGSFDLAR